MVNILPAFTFFRIKNDLFQFVHKGIDQPERLSKIILSDGPLEFVNIFCRDEWIPFEQLNDIDRLKRVFFLQVRIQVPDVPQSLHIKLVIGFEAFNQPVKLIMRYIKQSLGILSRKLRHLRYQLVHRGKPATFSVDTLIHILWKKIPECFEFSVVPEIKYPSRQPDECVITFCMNLLSEKMDQPVLSSRNLIHGSGYFPDFTFSTYFAEVHRKDPGELLDFLVVRCNV